MFEELFIEELSIRALTTFLWFSLNLGNKITFCFPIQITPHNSSLSFSIPLKYYLFTRYKFPIYPHIFYKVPTQYPMKGKKMREERGERREIFVLN